jgi:hypothetical protein
VADTASANYPLGYPFFPFGFYQPYGARYSNSIPTPPYFAINPPVYYGSRYARPYGASPFASPPIVRGSTDYGVRPADQFYRPPTPTPGPAIMCNPYVTCRKGDTPAAKTLEKTAQDATTPVGQIRFNPFVESNPKLAKR